MELNANIIDLIIYVFALVYVKKMVGSSSRVYVFRPTNQ
jgi:hypothetical protein